jgi:hypothetical protein
MTRPRALKVCSCTHCPAHPGSCPTLTTARHCPACGTQQELRRGRRQARGYGNQHDQLREQWRPKVEAGEVDCHADVCVMPARRLQAGQPWDLGHDRTTGKHRGPEHEKCNRSEGGKAAHSQ